MSHWRVLSEYSGSQAVIGNRFLRYPFNMCGWQCSKHFPCKAEQLMLKWQTIESRLCGMQSTGPFESYKRIDTSPVLISASCLNSQRTGHRIIPPISRARRIYSCIHLVACDTKTSREAMFACRQRWKSSFNWRIKIIRIKENSLVEYFAGRSTAWLGLLVKSRGKPLN